MRDSPKEDGRPVKTGKRRWWRWPIRIVVGLLALAIFLRVAIHVAMPYVAEAVCESLGLRLEFRNIKLSFLSLRVEMEDVALYASDAEEMEAPLLRLEWADVHFDLGALLSEGVIRFPWAELDGVDLRVEFEGDRTITLWDRIAEYAREADGSETGGREAGDLGVGDAIDPEDSASAEPGEHQVDLSLPIEFASVRIQHLRILFEDRRSGSELDADVLCYLRGTNLGSRTEINKLLFTAASPDLLEAMRLDVEGVAGPGSLKGSVALHIAEFEPAAVGAYLRSLGIWPEGKDVALELRAEVDISPRAGVPRAGVPREEVPREGVPREGAGRDEAGPVSKGKIAVTELKLFMDGETTLDLGQLEAKVLAWSSKRVHVERLSLDGVRARAGYREDGDLTLAGVSLLSTASSKTVDKDPDKDPDKDAGEDPDKDAGEDPGEDPGSQEEEGQDGDGMALRLDLIRIGDLHLGLVDERHGVEQDVRVQEISVSDLTMGVADPQPRMQLEGSLSLPGSVESWKFSGSFEPRGRTSKLHLKSRMSGLTLRGISPYLVAAGLQPELRNGEFSFSVTGRIEDIESRRTRIDLSLDGMKLKDGKDLLVLDKLEAKNWVQGGEDSGVGVQSLEKIELRGLGLELRRDEADRIHILGMQVLAAPGEVTHPGKPGAAEETVGSKAVAPVKGREQGRRFSLRHLVAHSSWIHLHDQSKRARLRDIHGLWSADVENLVLGDARGSLPPTEFNLQLSIPDILDRLEVKGRMEQVKRGQDLSMRLEGVGLQGENLKPFLQPLGVLPEFDSASLSLGLEIVGVGESGALPDKIQLTDVRFRDAERTLFELSSLHVQGLSSSKAGMRIGKVRIDGPALRVERDGRGALHFAGIVLEGEEPAKTPAEGDRAKPGANKGANEGPPVSRAASAEEVPEKHEQSGSSFRLGSLELLQARVDFADRFFGVQPEIPFILDLKLQDLSLDQHGPSLGFDLALSVPENLDRLRIHGDLSSRQGLALRLELEAKGIRKGSLAAYMPEGISLGMERGELQGKVSIGFEDENTGVEKKGGKRLTAKLEGFRLSDGKRELWRLDKLSLRASREAGMDEAYRIGELITERHEIHVTRDREKNLHLMGLVLEPATGEEEPEAPPEKDPEAKKAWRAKQALARLNRFRNMRTPMEQLASLHLGKLSLGLDKIHFRDESEALSKPLVGYLRVFNPEPMDLIPAGFDDLAPQRLTIEAGLQPIFRRMKLELSAQTWDIRPSLEASLEVEGIRGEGLTEVFPGLREMLHGRGLPDGTLKVDLGLDLQMRRSSRTSFPLENGFGMDFRIEGFELRDRPKGQILAGLDSLNVRMRRFEPRTGNLWIRTIGVDTPRARIVQTEEGMVFGGICLLMPKAASGGESEPETGEAITPASVETVASSLAPRRAPVNPVGTVDPVVRIDAITVSGLDMEIQDRRVSPPMILPITGMEVDLKNFVRGPSRDRRPMSFQVYIDGGDVDLPKREEAKGLIGGLVHGAVAVVDSEEEKVPMERRPAFDELGIKGAFHLSPSLRGRVRLDLTSVELQTFKSLAQRFGVVIGDGTLDLSTTVVMEESDQIQVSAYPVFTFLSLSEPKDGFLSSLLSLPAPLDTTLFLTRNSYGEHVFPISFTLEQGEISGGQIRTMVVKALSRSLATMVTNSPFRILGGVTSIVGLDINARNEEVGEPVSFSFEPGQTSLTGKQREGIRSLVLALKEDANVDIRVVHRSGVSDWDYAERLANPSRSDCLALAKGMFQKREELQKTRASLARRLISLYQNGRTEDAEKGGASLQRLDRELGELELSLEKLFEHLRPGAERQRGHRTKMANQAIALKRIETVVRELVSVGGEGFRERVETVQPRSRKDEAIKKGEILLIQRRRVGR